MSYGVTAEPRPVPAGCVLVLIVAFVLLALFGPLIRQARADVLCQIGPAKPPLDCSLGERLKGPGLSVECVRA